MLLFGVSGLLHLYIATRLIPPLAGQLWAWAPLALLLVVSALLVPASLLGLRRRSARGQAALVWAGLLNMGLFSSLFVLTLLRDVALGLAALAASLRPDWALPPAFGADSALAVLPLALLISLLGYANARRTARVVRVDVPIADLPDALHGFRIVQLSDIHVGPTIKRPYLQAVVDRANRLQADLVAVTGDLVDGRVSELGAHVEPLAALRSRHGTYFVTGNHEYYSGADAWVALLRGLGVRVLLNEHSLLEHDGAELVIAGVTDYSAHHFDPAQRSDPQGALAGAPASAALRVLLAHQPRSATAAAEAGYQLQLSGHTHGGQFLPWNFFVKLQQPFVAGLHRVRDLWVYTSRGTGYWGPPKRFGAPSEITQLRLIRA